MPVPKELKTPTKLSKILAGGVCIILPFVGFIWGIRYNELAALAEGKQTATQLKSQLNTIEVPVNVPPGITISVEEFIDKYASSPQSAKMTDSVIKGYAGKQITLNPKGTFAETYVDELDLRKNIFFNEPEQKYLIGYTVIYGDIRRHFIKEKANEMFISQIYERDPDSDKGITKKDSL